MGYFKGLYHHEYTKPETARYEIVSESVVPSRMSLSPAVVGPAPYFHDLPLPTVWQFDTSQHNINDVRALRVRYFLDAYDVVYAAMLIAVHTSGDEDRTVYSLHCPTGSDVDMRRFVDFTISTANASAPGGISRKAVFYDAHDNQIVVANWHGSSLLVGFTKEQTSADFSFESGGEEKSGYPTMTYQYARAFHLLQEDTVSRYEFAQETAAREAADTALEGKMQVLNKQISDLTGQNTIFVTR